MNPLQPLLIKNMTTGVRNGWIGDRSKKLYRHTKRMEQMVECLVAAIWRMDANKVKAEDTLKQMKEEIMVGLETMIQNQEKMMARLDAHHERMMVRMKASLEKTETRDLEANPEETESESEHAKVPQVDLLGH
jgi:hypothetical protein